jgi:lysophospholipase L1-like esterase
MHAQVHVALLVGLLGACGAAAAQPSSGLVIDWEAANRFRLFADEADFRKQVQAAQNAPGGRVLAVERHLAEETAGRGWARQLEQLCYDSWRGRPLDTCKRDGVPEKYINPLSARIRLEARLPAGFGQARCTWKVGTGAPVEKDCADVVDDQRASTKSPTSVSVVARTSAGASLEAKTAIQVRDVLIVGLGDSIAAGEGNPTRPVGLSDDGFCFRRVLTFSSETFFLPGRAGAQVVADCPQFPTDIPDGERERWDRAAAGWLYDQCHRSLYSYQARAALALAVQNRQITVTYLPLGCSGATIREGMLGSQPARERPKKGTQTAPRDVEAQFTQLANYLGMGATMAKKPLRPVDLILLTVGANDIGFSGLVANVIVDDDHERKILKSTIVAPAKARQNLGTVLRGDFRRLRTTLQKFTGGTPGRVVFATYGNPATHNDGQSCPTTRRGFDAHPAFAVHGGRLEQTVRFVEDEFVPRLRSYATCGADGGCANPAQQRMVYVDQHRAEFAKHGLCAVSDDDPVFDRDCFKAGNSFNTLQKPLACDRRPAEFRAYRTRARWIRTVNDSYFAAMTYPAKSSTGTPTDIHDGRWGLEAVVYGGAIHPTAEGHAAMADAVLSAARTQLGLPAPSTLISSNR